MLSDTKKGLPAVSPATLLERMKSGSLIITYIASSRLSSQIAQGRGRDLNRYAELYHSFLLNYLQLSSANDPVLILRGTYPDPI